MGEVEESVAGVVAGSNGVKHWEFVIALGGIYSCAPGAENEVRDRVEKAIEKALLPMDKDGVSLLQQTFSKREVGPERSREARTPVTE